MALGQEHCEKGGWTCLELASSFEEGIRAGEDSSDEGRWEIGKEEDVSDAQHGGASSRRRNFGIRVTGDVHVDRIRRQSCSFCRKTYYQNLRFSFRVLAITYSGVLMLFLLLQGNAES